MASQQVLRSWTASQLSLLLGFESDDLVGYLISIDTFSEAQDYLKVVPMSMYSYIWNAKADGFCSKCSVMATSRRVSFRITFHGDSPLVRHQRPHRSTNAQIAGSPRHRKRAQRGTTRR